MNSLTPESINKDYLCEWAPGRFASEYIPISHFPFLTVNRRAEKFYPFSITFYIICYGYNSHCCSIQVIIILGQTKERI
jgi:hypothetical protein